MHIQFKSIRLKRFRSFLDETIINFEDAGAGLYFLKGRNEASPGLGSNGAGKSTVIDALLWGLYGRTVLGLKNPDIVPWEGKGTTEVEVIVQIGKKNHTIKRTANPNLVTDNGTEMGQADVSKLIPIPFDIIPLTLILGQKQPLFFDLTSSEKMKVFSESLNLSKWDERSEHAKKQVDGLEMENNHSYAEIAAWKDAVERLKLDRLSLKAKSENWETARELALSNKDKELKQHQKKIDAVQDARIDADLSLENAEIKLRTLNLESLRREARTTSLALAKSELAFKASVAGMNDIISQMDQVKDQVCPTCKQMLKGKHHQNKMLDSLEKQVSDMGLEERKKAYKEAQERSEKAELALRNAEIEETKLRKVCEECRDELDRFNNIIAEASGNIKAINRLKEEYEGQDNPFREQIQSVQSRITETTARIEDRTAKLDTKKQYCERLRFWVKGFKDIKLYTLEEILQELEISSCGMLDQFGLADWSLRYDVERETKSGTIARGINVEVLSPDNKKPVRWECWSGGTAQRISLIGSLALRSVLLNHLGVTTNLMVVDEPTIGLSTEGITDLVELLSHVAKDTKSNIWMIDHHAVETSRFVKTVTVVKDKKGSRIE